MFRTCALETVKSCISLFLLLANLCFQVVSVLTNTHLLLHVRDTLKTFHKSSVTAILVIMFWMFLIIQIRSKSLQIKRQLISSITNLVDELPHDLSDDLRLRIFGNQEIRKMSNVGGDAAQCTVFLQEIKRLEVLFNFTIFFYFRPNILSRIV